MKIDSILLDKLTALAKESPRLRSIMMVRECWSSLLCWEIATSLTLLAMTFWTLLLAMTFWTSLLAMTCLWHVR